MGSLSLILTGLLGSSPWVVAQGYPPREAASKMTVAPGFQVDLIASEPLIKQPVAIDFDDRGRLWVIQYLQYPNPNGLKRKEVDRYSRTKYDTVPLPPPRGPKGADRITILEDTDGDGLMDRGKDFVTGLNIVSSFAFGHGGVYVLNVPYLLFYADRNRDDIPDGDPEVLLSGFGMEDAHSVANSLTFGPDGWLYGCQGSTVTSNIRGKEFQQGVWRYHPKSRIFELFCEGGGNSWGLDFDKKGRLFYSTNLGGHVLLHGVPGGYYWKSFGKHGALHNPHTYGFFDHAPHRNFQGGHVTVGGLVYQGNSFPQAFQGKFLAADLLGHAISWHEVHPRGSTVSTSHGGTLVRANDTWFAPTDLTLGPDGAIYVSDWHDARTAHPDPDADWDRTNGRIFRLAARGTPRPSPVDLTQMSDEELLQLHEHPNVWYIRKARQELVRRTLASHSKNPVRERLLARIRERDKPSRSLESLWTHYCLGYLDFATASELLDHPDEAIRAWTIRFLGEMGEVPRDLAHRLDKLAEKEPSVGVRIELACLAKRIPPQQALPIINANINRDLDASDPFLPLLWWWAVETHAVSGKDEVMKRFVRPTLAQSKLGSEFLLPRLIRRYSSEKDYKAVAQLLQSTSHRIPLWSSVLAGLQDKENLTGLEPLVERDWIAQPQNLVLWELALRLGIPHALENASREVADPSVPIQRRLALIPFLAATANESLAPLFLGLARSQEEEALRIAAIQALGRFAHASIATDLISIHKQTSSQKLKGQIREVIFSRPTFAMVWLQKVDQGELVPETVGLDEVRKVSAWGDEGLNRLITKHWGIIKPPTREDKLAEVRRLNNDLRAGNGNLDRGKVLFTKHCAGCHTLFGEGNHLGPDLTTANRQDRDFLLISLVDPSGTIRKEFVSLIVTTKQGQILTGVATARNQDSITLADAKNEKKTIAIGDIESVAESEISLMPDNLHRQWSPSELRDLFSYLQAKRGEK